MFRSLLVALASTALLASVAAASPHSLGKGHWSLGYTSDRESTIQLGIGVADMTRIIANVGLENVDPGNNVDSQTTFSIGGALHRYLSGMSTDIFSPFLGAGVGVSEIGVDNQDANIDVFGGFGGEAFVAEPVSIGGFVGLGYTKSGDADIDTDSDPTTPPVHFEGDKTFGTLRSAITATLYWGSDSSPEE